MRAVVVFESMFGNTQAIAEAIASGLRSSMPVDVVEVGAAPPRIGTDVSLLVVGGPTHAFGLSRPSTRKDAAGQSSRPLVSQGPGLREWLGTLPRDVAQIPAAAFDTHVDKRVPGSAARSAHRRLGRLGFVLVAEPESFYVTDVAGPLVDEEETRARAWGRQLGTRAAGLVAAQPS